MKRIINTNTLLWVLVALSGLDTQAHTPHPAPTTQNPSEQLLSLRRNLKTLQKIIEHPAPNRDTGMIQEARQIITDSQNLCNDLAIDGIDWEHLRECILCNRASANICPGLCAKISQIISKICSLILTLGVGQQCNVPLDQTDIPFTASVDGQSYVLVEELTHTGASSAFTITADRVTIDMCGHQLSATTMTSPVVSITGSQAMIKNGNFKSDGSDTIFDFSSTATQGVLDRVSLLVTAGSSDAVVSDAENVWMRNIDIQMDSTALGQGIDAKKTTKIEDFFIRILNSTGSGGAAIDTTTAGSPTGGVSIRNGQIDYRRDDIGTFPDQAALFFTIPSGTDSPDAVAENILIRTVGDARAVYLSGGGNAASLVLLKNLDLISFSTGVDTGIGIHVNGARAAIRNCRMTHYEVGIQWETAIGYAANNSTISCETGYSVLTSRVALENNTANNSSTAGFSVSTASGRDVFLRNNCSVNDASGGASGTGFSIAAAATSVTVIGNTAMGHTTGFLDSGATTVLFANNTAVGNTTDYSGVLKTFSAAAITTEGYWHNITP